jgi:hypothetical protein
MNTIKAIHKAIKKINPSAEASMSGSDILAVDTIVWENGTTPINKQAILDLVPECVVEIEAEAQAKIDNKNNALSKLQALGLSEAEVKELFKL